MSSSTTPLRAEATLVDPLRAESPETEASLRAESPETVIDMTGVDLTRAVSPEFEEYKRMNRDKGNYSRPMMPAVINAAAALAIFGGDTWVNNPDNADKASKRAMSIDPESGLIGRDKVMEKSGTIPEECQLNLSSEALAIYNNFDKVARIIMDMLTHGAAAGLTLFMRQVYNTIAFSVLSNMAIFKSFVELYAAHDMQHYGDTCLRDITPEDPVFELIDPVRTEDIPESHLPKAIQAFLSWAAWAINNKWAWSTDPLTAAILIGLDGDSDDKRLDDMQGHFNRLFQGFEAGKLTDNPLYNGFVDIYSDAMLTDLTAAKHLSSEEIDALESIRNGLETDLDRFGAYSPAL